MSARLRARAVGLIRQLDAGEGYRDEIEKALASRLGAMPRAAQGAASHAEASGSATRAAVVPPAKDPIPPTRLCGACGTVNEADALFCKHCGANLEPPK
jgi:hypothetical protein